MARRAVRAWRGGGNGDRHVVRGLEDLGRGQRCPNWGGKTFAKALDERGFIKGKNDKFRGFKGIKLRPKTPEEAFKDAGKPGWSGSL